MILVKNQEWFYLKMGNKSVKRFIYSYENLKEVIDELNFKAIKILNSDENSNDSYDSINSELMIIIYLKYLKMNYYSN